MEKTIKDKIQMSAIVLAIAMIFLITFFNIRGSVRLIVVAGFMAIFVLQPLNMKIAMLFYISAFTADLGVSFGVPAISVLQLFCIVHFLYRRNLQIDIGFAVCTLTIFISQIYSMFMCRQDMKNVIVFLVNFFLMYLVYTEMKETDVHQYRIALTLYVVGVFAAVLAGIYRRGSDVESWVRFKGIWTDPNFMGMFCVLACCAVLSLAKGKARRWIIAFPVLVLMVYGGYLTQSRTFIYACGILILVYMFNVLTDSKISAIKKIFIALLLILAAFFVYNKLLINVVEQRGITSSVGGEDWTNGRLSLTKYNFEVWSKNVFTMLFGYGVGNSQNYTSHVSHNTYADLLFELGLIGLIAIADFFVVRLNEINWKKGKIYYVIIALYAATLSMQSTDMLYLFLGLLSFQFKENDCTLSREERI